MAFFALYVMEIEIVIRAEEKEGCLFTFHHCIADVISVLRIGVQCDGKRPLKIADLFVCEDYLIAVLLVRSNPSLGRFLAESNAASGLISEIILQGQRRSELPYTALQRCGSGPLFLG